jgi:hypothetical protein
VSDRIGEFTRFVAALLNAPWLGTLAIPVITEIVAVQIRRAVRHASERRRRIEDYAAGLDFMFAGVLVLLQTSFAFEECVGVQPSPLGSCGGYLARATAAHVTVLDLTHVTFALCAACVVLTVIVAQCVRRWGWVNVGTTAEPRWELRLIRGAIIPWIFGMLALIAADLWRTG